MKLRFSILTPAVLLAAGLHLANAAEPPELEGKRLEITRLQIFLNNANFAPGKIDGREGEFTQRALGLYREAKGGNEASGADGGKKEGLNFKGLDLSSVEPVIIEYTVTAEDAKDLGKVPKEPAEQEKQKSMPYESVLEVVAEKFFADQDFIKELNPKMGDLKEGDTIFVPNVQPFDFASVKDIKAGESLEGSTVAAIVGEDAAGEVAIRIDTKTKMLHVRRNEQLIAAFPVTPGSDAIPTPRGNWKVKGVATMPDFRRDEKLLKEGERGEEAHIIPPGPNNPVGVIWIALNKPGIGIHGTNEPDTIGRAASHGCVRLANWDAAKLAQMVKAGVPVTID